MKKTYEQKIADVWVKISPYEGNLVLCQENGRHYICREDKVDEVVTAMQFPLVVTTGQGETLDKVYPCCTAEEASRIMGLIVRWEDPCNIFAINAKTVQGTSFQPYYV